MQYDPVIKRTLRTLSVSCGRICPQLETFPMMKQSNPSAPLCVLRQALEHGNDTALCFVLRAVNRILSDDDQPNRTTINRLWDVLDEPELNRALGIKSRPGY